MRRLTPSQVLDLQGLCAAELSGGGARHYVEIVASSMYVSEAKTGDEEVSVKSLDGVGVPIAANLASLVKGAHTFHVQAEMTDLIMAASLGLDDEMPWRRELLPTEVGFVYLDKPIIMQDVRGNDMKIHAVVWGPASTNAGPSTAIYFMNDIEDPDDVVLGNAKANKFTQEQMRACGRLQVVHIMFVAGHQPIGPPKVLPNDDKAQDLMAEGVIAVPADNGFRQFVAYLRLLSQTLVQLASAEVDRHARKRATRRGLPGLVTTVKLRRIEYVGGEGHSNVEWQHRWIVRGHWRRQPCGPDHPLAENNGQGGHVAIIWINPYIKGPEDKPLHLSNKVYDLAR